MSVYPIAAVILDKAIQKKANIKTLVLTNKYPNKKELFALVCETLKYKTILQEILKQVKLPFEPLLALLLLYDHLIGKGVKGKYKPTMNKFHTKLFTAFTKAKIKHKVKDTKDLIPEHLRDIKTLPRYVRVNTLKITMQEAMKQLPQAKVDPHVPNLLILPHTDLHLHPLYLNGSIILQDKASCFPAVVLSPPLNSTCLDACAAPGNKTSHLSSILENTGKIYAFDKDPKRLQTLKNLTQKAGCKNIVALLQDFLSVDPNDFSDVEYILLDPSCSGSGITSRMDALVHKEEMDQERVEKLAEFQQSAILHAFSFPNVKKVVYSTCSKHSRENEQVVDFVLQNSRGWALETAKLNSDWETRGIQQPETIRAGEQDLTIGFFVALFKKVV